jgi:hypothetical protein
MTRLELWQRGLLDLIKDRGIAPKDSYLVRMARSPEIAIVREIALWWRAFDLEANCGFSARLLKRLGRFHVLVAEYFNDNATSPFAEEVSLDFLTWLQGDDDPFVRTVSFFEREVLLARGGASGVFEVCWDRNPDLVFRALAEGTEIPRKEPGYVYRMAIASNLPHFVTCTRESDPSDRQFDLVPRSTYFSLEHQDLIKPRGNCL